MWDRAGEQHWGRSGAELSLDLTPELRKEGSTSITARGIKLDVFSCRWRKLKANKTTKKVPRLTSTMSTNLEMLMVSFWNVILTGYSERDPFLRTWRSQRPSPAFLILWDSGPPLVGYQPPPVQRGHQDMAGAWTCLSPSVSGDPQQVTGTGEEPLDTSWSQTPIYQQGCARDSLGSCELRKPH